MTFRLAYLSFVLTKTWKRDVQPFSNLGKILYHAKVGGPQKVVQAKFCSYFLLFVPKFRCSLKKGLPLESRSYSSIFAPNIFQQSRATPLRNPHYSQKTGNRRWAEGWISLGWNNKNLKLAISLL